MRDRIIVSKGRGGNVIAIIFWCVGKTDRVEWVEVEVFLGRDEGRVGPEEAGRDEERFVPFFSHEFDRFSGDHSVGLFFVSTIGGEPAEGTADLAVRFGIEDKVFVGFVAADGIDDTLPRRLVIEAIGADAGGDVVVVDFTHTGHVIAILNKMLGEGDGIGNGSAKMLVEVVDFDLVGPEPGHDGGPAGVAERELIVGPVKSDALSGEAVDVWCFDHEISVTTQRRSEIIDGDEEDIGLFGCGSESAGKKEEASEHVDVDFYES